MWRPLHHAQQVGVVWPSGQVRITVCSSGLVAVACMSVMSECGGLSIMLNRWVLCGLAGRSVSPCVAVAL